MIYTFNDIHGNECHIPCHEVLAKLGSVHGLDMKTIAALKALYITLGGVEPITHANVAKMVLEKRAKR